MINVNYSRSFVIATASCAVLGAVVLVASFMINPAPAANLGTVQLRDFAIRHHDRIVLGGWLQGMGSLLLVLFAIALVHLAAAKQRVAGWMTLLSCATILMTSLTEITFYLGAVSVAETGDVTSAIACNALIKAVQHVFLIAPALLLPLGFVLLGSPALPRAFGHAALLIGATLQTLGLVGLFVALQPIIDMILVIQALWFVSAGVTMLVRPSDCAHA